MQSWLKGYHWSKASFEAASFSAAVRSRPKKAAKSGVF
jgi:hypothetical protein